MASSGISNELACKLLATGFTGLTAGALAFGSFVDVRTLLKVLDGKDTALIQRFFPIWWPHGRDFMVTVILAGTAAHVGAWRLSGDRTWAYAGAALFAILPYTAIVLAGDIKALRYDSAESIDATTRRFCFFHHPRLGMATVTFAVSLLALSGRK